MSIFRYMPSAFESAAGFLQTYTTYPDLTMDILHKVRNEISKDNFELSVLSNAFTEVKDLKEYDELLKGEVKTYSDSGGLQVLTRGFKMTTELKEQIYSDQCNYSDYAMCFDELPVRTLGERTSSSGLDSSGRFFVDTLFQTDGRATGKNVLHQIQTFKKIHQLNKDNELGAKPHGKILIILQGSTFKTIREFAWFLYEEIKNEPNWSDYVSGLAIGNTTNMGVGSLTDSILRFQKELEFFPDSIKNNIHILGAGTITKIFSFFIMKDTYWNTKDFILSADSTTQTKAMQFGNYITFDGERKVTIQTGRDVNKKTKDICSDIFTYHKDLLEQHNMEICVNEPTRESLREEIVITMSGSTLEEIEVEYQEQLHNLQSYLYRQHYTQFNQYCRTEFNKKCDKTDLTALRLRDDFSPYGDRKLEDSDENNEASHQHKKRSIFSKYFWTMKMISDYFRHLSAVKSIANQYRNKEIDKKETIKQMTPLLTSDAYIALLDVKSHTDYMKGYEDEIVTGHPYDVIPSDVTLSQLIIDDKEVTNVYTENTSDVFGLDKIVYWIVDTPEDGVMRGRCLLDINNHTENVIESVKLPKVSTLTASPRRSVLQLGSFKIPMVPFIEWDLTKYTQIKEKELNIQTKKDNKQNIVTTDLLDYF